MEEMKVSGRRREGMIIRGHSQGRDEWSHCGKADNDVVSGNGERIFNNQHKLIDFGG